VITLLLLVVTFSVSATPFSRNAELKKQDLIMMNAVYQSLLNGKASSKRNKPALVKASFNTSKNKSYNNRLRVTATAYTSHAAQTDSTPNIAAWGDRLHPGMKAIAVSRDLLKVYGLRHGQMVRIKGLDGEYAVLDKMNKRWRKKIDIYMGMNKRKAFKWGRRKVEIMWNKST
jgi:3D (Asp-Asp-Asp) domain-containing protein